MMRIWLPEIVLPRGKTPAGTETFCGHRREASVSTVTPQRDLPTPSPLRSRDRVVEPHAALTAALLGNRVRLWSVSLRSTGGAARSPGRPQVREVATSSASILARPASSTAYSASSIAANA